MPLHSSLEEEFSLLTSFFERHMDPPIEHKPSTIPSKPKNVEDQRAQITPPPELRIRNPVPEPQNAVDTCSQAEQSASQAIRQAGQSASQAAQQASQSASQAIQQANQSASQSIQQAQQQIQQASASASRSVSAASQSIASVQASASSAIASAQSSANAAVSKANMMMTSAQGSAMSAQSAASSAVLQAGAAVAAATGSAAAAGSSFLAAAAKATESAQASISGIAAQAAQQVTASQTAAITATQAALAIVGSVIASALITILIYFLLSRHKKKIRERSQEQKSPGTRGFYGDAKFPTSDQDGTTLAGSKTNNSRGDRTGTSQVTLSPFPSRATTGDEKPTESGTAVKTTSVQWNPSKPPKAPTLGTWLKLQAPSISPFGPINLPTDIKNPSPLGGQLKSPLQSKAPRPQLVTIPSIKRKPSMKDLSRAPPISQEPNPLFAFGIKTSKVPASPVPASNIVQAPKRRSSLPQNIAKQKPLSQLPAQAYRESISQNPFQPPNSNAYRESKTSIWTDEPMDESPDDPPPRSPLRTNPPPSTTSINRSRGMQIPSPVNPVRNTAEWLAAAEASLKNAESSVAISEGEQAQRRSAGRSMTSMTETKGRPSFVPGRGSGLPSGGPRSGLPRRMRQSINGNAGEDEGYVVGLNRFLAEDQRGSVISRSVSGSLVGTPGVGKAL